MIQHISLLMGQGNYKEALKRLQILIAETPEYPYLHVLAAHCFNEIEQYKNALDEANQAISLDPEYGEAYNAKAVTYIYLDKFKEAKDNVEIAISLNPDSESFYANLAEIESVAGHWQESLEAAELGLMISPQDLSCNNLRAQALRKLGRTAEADITLDSVLTENPEDSFTHASMGWALLEKGNYKQAFEHFREALRLEPGNEYARQGIIHAMQARSRIYRLCLKYFFWTSKLSREKIFKIIIGLYLVNILVRSMGKAFNEIQPIAKVFNYAYLIFALSTWLTQPFFNLLLNFDSFGRLVLTKRERIESVFFGLFIMIAGVAFIWSLFTNQAIVFNFTLFGIFMAIAIAGIQQQSQKIRIQQYIVFSAVLCLLGISALVFEVLIGVNMIAIFILPAIIYQLMIMFRK
ncbi:MAG: tetratricopeptide repeat protein [Lentisphaeria bacterium]|nr:tetratricopeptide repeat protein [Lentisphaeria bacterium]